jgi:hypothetical protein
MVRAGFPVFAELVIFLEEKEMAIVNFPNRRDAVFISRFTPWYHGNHIKGRVSGEIILEYLKQNDLFNDCAGVRELGQIEQEGIYFFRERFQGNVVFGLRDIIEDAEKDCWAPCLLEFGGIVVRRFFLLKAPWFENYVALRIATNTRPRIIARGEYAEDNLLFFTGKVS